MRCVSGLAATGLLLDLGGELLVWRREGEEYQSEDDVEEDGGHGATLDVRQLGALTRNEEARLGCTAEEAAMQVHTLSVPQTKVWPRYAAH